MSKFSVKFLILGLVIFISGVSFFVPNAYSYYQSKQTEKQGDILLSENKYQEALDKYNESNRQFSSSGLLAKTAKAEDLLDSDSNYKAGNEAIENKQWDEAIITLSKVSSNHKDYDRAQNLMGFAKQEKMKAEEQVRVLGESDTVVSQSQTVIDQDTNPTVSNTPTPSPEIKYRDVSIMGAVVKCRADKYSEIMETKQKMINTYDTSYDCMSKCADELSECSSKCNENIGSSYYQSCLSNCGSARSSCLSICKNRGISDVKFKSDILGNLLDLYCIE